MEIEELFKRVESLEERVQRLKQELKNIIEKKDDYSRKID